MIKKQGKANQTTHIKGEARLLPKLSLFFFDRPRVAAIIWLVITVFGILSYTTFLRREGFPSIQVPYTFVTGAYFVNDPTKVDATVAKPLSDEILKNADVKSVQTQSQANFYLVTVQYKEGTDSGAATKALEKQVTDAKIIPAQATAKFEPLKFGFTSRGDDMVISFYSKENSTDTKALVAEAQKTVDYLNTQNLSLIENISVINPFVAGVNTTTGQPEVNQKNFDRYGERQDNANNFYNSVAIGVTKKAGADTLKADDQVREALAKYNHDSEFEAVISASFAPQIRDQIDELQRVLLEGLIAVLLVGSIVIAVRASLITVLSMITVLATTIGILFLIGYTLNTITLFALILALALIVDDTIIMVEAIDAQRKRQKDARQAVGEATKRVSKAMISATSTAALSFAPLIFVGGILGGFIRAIPVTIITALITSLVVALIFIPLFARYLLLGKKQMGETHDEIAAGFEAKVASFIGKPMIWAKDSKKKLVLVGLTAVFIGLGFIMASGVIFQKVTFNIFPSSKDSNGLTTTLSFAPGSTIDQAQATADKADAIVGKTLGENFKIASYYGQATAQKGALYIDLISYKSRDVTSPELIKQLEGAFVGFQGAEVKVGQQDAGPPSSPFVVKIKTDNRTAAFALANDMNKFLNGKEFTRASGTTAKIIRTSVSDPGSYIRNNGVQYVSVTAEFDGTDTTTLVTLAQSAVEKEFNKEKLATYGLESNVLQFDFGQESENQDSFKTLAIAFPALLAVIYVLLAFQFRSFLQPLLIFMAIPFSLFGITLGLYLTDNAFSFFAMLGFFALIGLSIKNTILLTDFANQARRRGASGVDAAVEALQERFRPLVATSLTAVVALIPLALTSPFWEGLAVVLVCGLISSTLLVITVFPYYYLGAEFLRVKSSKFARKLRRS